MALTPLSQLIQIKPRPETTINLQTAVNDPEGTIRDYVFTGSLKEAVADIIDNASAGRGRGYWVSSQYGGGKTHLLAAVSALLSAPGRVRDLVDDEDMREAMDDLRDSKIFPVSFSLIGRNQALNPNQALYTILEEEIASAAEKALGHPITVTLLSEVRKWWEGLTTGIRESMEDKFQQICGEHPDQVWLDSEDTWMEIVAQSSRALQIGIPVPDAPLERLQYIYQQIVNKDTGYTGMLVIIDEFAAWQDRNPEGTVVYNEGENLLQTLAEALPQEHHLSIITIVGSQKDMPGKFQGDRFHRVDVLRLSEQDGGPSREYELVVAKRVRNLDPDKSPEIEAYYNHYHSNSQFARDQSLEDFRASFPVQPLCFDILRRITSTLQGPRVGINTLWDLFGVELDNSGGKKFQVNPFLEKMCRLVTAADLLESTTLNDALESSARFNAAYHAFKQGELALERLDMDSASELPLAKAVLRTVFLWYVAYLGQTSMSLKEMSEAVVAEEGILNAEDAVLNVTLLMEGISQLAYDQGTQQFNFDAQITTGRPVQEILEEHRALNAGAQELEKKWQEYLTAGDLAANNLSSIFHGMNPGVAKRTSYVHRGIEYIGDETVSEWHGDLGRNLVFDRHFSLVYLTKTVNVTSDALLDRRIAVCIPGEFSETDQSAIRDLIAVDRMASTYQHDDGDEALRVKEFARTRRPEFISRLLMAQRERYKRGSIVTKDNIALTPDQVFSMENQTSQLNEGLLGSAYSGRPAGPFARANVQLKAPDIGNLFQGLWDPTAGGAVGDALTNFAVGLGLALPAAPRVFEPSACDAFDVIRQLYQAAQQSGQPVQAMKIYEAFAEKGIPARLVTLYLLCFVRRGGENTELLLRQGHSLRLRNSAAPPEHRVTGTLVAQVEWQNRWAGDDCLKTFESLSPSSGLLWNDGLKWAREIRPELKTATTPEEIETQQTLLLDSLATLKHRAEQGKTGLDTLALSLGQEAPQELMQQLDKAKAIAGAQDHEELAQLAQKAFGDASGLAQVVDAAERASELAILSPIIASANSYLKTVPQDRLQDPNLEADRVSVLSRLVLASLANDLTKWTEVEESISQWRKSYQVAYRIMHRDHQLALALAHKSVPDVDRRLKALEHLEQVRGLPAVGEHQAHVLRNALQVAQVRIQPCSVDVNELNLEAQPHCGECQVRVGDEAAPDLAGLADRVDQALEARLVAFQHGAIRKLLEEAEDSKIQELVGALDLSDRDKLVELIQLPDLVALLDAVLGSGRDHQLKIRTVRLADELKKEFPTVTRDQLDEVQVRIMDILQRELEAAEQEAGVGAEIEVQII